MVHFMGKGVKSVQVSLQEVPRVDHLWYNLNTWSACWKFYDENCITFEYHYKIFRYSYSYSIYLHVLTLKVLVTTIDA